MTIDIKTLPLKIEFVARTVRDENHAGQPWQCFEWRCTLTSKNASWTFPYYCGLAHVHPAKNRFMDARPKAPTAEDVFHSLLMDASAADENFHDWCENYGYSDDSIKALNIYKDCLNIGTQLRKHLGRDVVEALRVQLADH